MSETFNAETFFTEESAPASARMLGWKLIEADEAEGRILLEFDAKEEFLNPAGVVQGGFLAAMLDDAMGPAIVVKSGGKTYATTIDMHVHYLRPVRPGRVRVEAWATQIGRSVAFAEAKLYDAKGRLAARASCSSKILKDVFMTPSTSKPGQEAQNA